MTQLSLFADQITCVVCGTLTEPRRERAPVCPTCMQITHVLMPNMSYACYETILTVAGHSVCGTARFDQVTCTACIAEGVEAIRIRMRRQTGHCIHCAERLAKNGACDACGGDQ